ncbi:C-terminal processing protease CtpA/Prc, contains a PDZ domain [Robiginitalea myxolifaciens]|uniref:C-terminal processing protease CtpA/Prc, contains a PDZ domain n=1 Tax=Robiginitalea myxolifaciens TaxID=400055 RepID=A0A1I6HCR0_9FLAO|nr:S41 family peptidase [Robiginitalea myxolifaciens]SFR52140.1 C-terminal processing protease CtpA/Prc, contains a PDZ domain [Robiginitalea myxolifaciens]
MLSFTLNAQTEVTFFVEDIPEGTENVGIRGNTAPLSWESSAVLQPSGTGYSIQLTFPQSGADLEYKFVLFERDNDVIWENTPNRSLKLPATGELITVNAKWNREQVLDISKLEPIPPELLLEDYKLVETLVLDLHPGTYRYKSKSEIQAALDRLKGAFSEPQTHQQAYLAVSRMMATLQCDHTKAGFNNQTPIINSIIHYQPDKLPFTFRWFGDEMILKENASQQNELQRGTEIVAINGIPVGDIKREMLPYIGADGATDKNREYKMEINGYDFRYNAFDIFFPLLYPIENNQVQLEIRQPGETDTKAITVTTLTREDRSALLASRYPDFPETRDEMWSFEILPGEIAKLTLNSFGLMGWKAMTIDYKAFLDAAFSEIRNSGISNLIIDIRENNGGNDEMAIELFEYLARTMPAYDREGRTRYKSFPESLKSHIRTWGDNPWYYELKPKTAMTEEGYYIFEEEGNRKKSKKPIYEGNTYLLTSPANTSLAFYTALRFKTQNLGVMIGGETGGNLNDINGGQIIFLTLPHSQIEIDSPVMGGFSREPQPNTGVMPDIVVPIKKEDLQQGRDVVLEQALALIQKR